MSALPAWLLLVVYHLVVAALFVLSAAAPVVVVWLLFRLDLGGSSRGDLLLALPVIEGVLLYVYAQAALFALSVRRAGVQTHFGPFFPTSFFKVIKCVRTHNVAHVMW